ncbi:hypothetical protein Tfer_0449 [Thermincola ferriacetica]|uniref:2-phosphosulfolactate phosphatase n=1 Tax=Thermincola ferriacetica TaxID=281456 RepID=A0A0L6W5G6_9FIRM|nr:hypothetical protein [Thermincola ferriacetica]KNZ70770.1 hypothetical protein Tfer_0449 [Thermincola ferriacetica]
MQTNFIGVNVTANATGAVAAAMMGHLVMVVDVIDMSTTLEAALDAGAVAVFGASPDSSRAPVDLNPEKIGMEAGSIALRNGTEVVLISEPRVGTDEERLQRASKAVAGIKKSGARIAAVVPNNGAETAKLVDFKNKVVLAVTDTGGVAYDAAFNAGAPAVVTGTIARTMQKRGIKPAHDAAARAVEQASRLGVGITVVAATANSLEDILAAEYIARLILEKGFTQLK